MTEPFNANIDRFDIREVIERFEELESDRENATHEDGETLATFAHWELENPEDAEELALLEKLLGDVAGYGGDEQWRGEWYPMNFIHEDHFVDAMEELVKDIGDIPHNIPGYLAIDWTATAENLRVDYSSVEIDGETFWYR